MHTQSAMSFHANTNKPVVLTCVLILKLLFGLWCQRKQRASQLFLLHSVALGRCGGRQCVQFAHCYDYKCHCDNGYSGNGYQKCYSTYYVYIVIRHLTHCTICMTFKLGMNIGLFSTNAHIDGLMLYRTMSNVYLHYSIL